MRVSCLPVSYFGSIVGGEMSVGQWAKQGADLGLDGIDLSCLFLESLEPSYLDEMRGSIEATGMRVAMLCTYPDFTHPDSGERVRQIDLERAHIEAAGRLGCELVRITAGQAYPALDEREGIQWALDGLKACEGAAEESGVRLVLENHSKPGCWDYADFDLASHVFLALADRLRDTTIGINFDTANPIVYGDDPLPVLEHVLEQVISVHAADTRNWGVLDPVVLGTGLVPFRELFSYLKRNGFDGWICIEEASRTGARGFEHAVSFVRRTWEDV